MALLSVKVIHFSITPLAGSPIRIVKALTEHTDVKARLVVLQPHAYGERTFENDLTWEHDREEALSLLEEADIIHLHHYMDLENNLFGIKFKDFLNRKKRLVYQFHSTPFFIANGDKALLRRIMNEKMPQLVISQYPERFYPRARVVPNIVPLDEELYRRKKPAGDYVSIFFAPSVSLGSWESRWDTKGFPETCFLLERISRRNPKVKLRIIQNTPHSACLKERQCSHINIDDMVTGSFHLCSLEGLAQGLPTFAYLDTRILWNIHEMTGSNTLPWMNFRLEEAENPLKILIADSELRDEIGENSRRWMERYWNDQDMIRHYVGAYQDLLEGTDVFQEPRFNIYNKRSVWFVRGADDVIWEARRKHFPIPLLLRVRYLFELFNQQIGKRTLAIELGKALLSSLRCIFQDRRRKAESTNQWFEHAIDECSDVRPDVH